MQQFHTLQPGDSFRCCKTGSIRKVLSKFHDHIVERNDCGWLVTITPGMIGWNKMVVKIK